MRDVKRIFDFLADIKKHNDREWFTQHKPEYIACRDDFRGGIREALDRIGNFDQEITGLEVDDCEYRFYRDLRFSQDKSPYKTHFGAYICGHGKKAMRGGYYIHLEPNNCFFAVGAYCLPTQVLTACRNEILVNADRWMKIVGNKHFVELFGIPSRGIGLEEPKGFGLNHLKTIPKDFPKDFEHSEYLKMKDYCAWHQVPDALFYTSKWLDYMEDVFLTAKPMMDFINPVIDDYE